MTVARELQTYVVTTLRADAAVAALVDTRIYDNVPKSATYPYIALGPMQIVQDRADCKALEMRYIQIDVHTRDQAARLNCLEIVEAVTEALDQKSADLGVHALCWTELELTRVMTDSDGISAQGVLSFAFHTEKN